MSVPGLTQLGQSDGERAVLQLVRPYIPRAGKTVDICDRRPVGAHDMGEALQVTTEDQVLDERLLTPVVDLLVGHGSSESGLNLGQGEPQRLPVLQWPRAARRDLVVGAAIELSARS